MSERSEIYRRDQARKQARGQLIGNTRQTAENLRPGNLVNRWVSRQKLRLSDTKDNVLDGARRNKSLIGAAAIGAALFFARRPLSRLIDHFARHKR